MTDPRPAPGRRRIGRFSRAERLVHRLTAGLMLVCIITAAILYNGSISLRVGHRHVVELVHVYSGLALPVPMLSGLISLAYRADLSRLNRFTSADWRWLRSRGRDARSLIGKFNAGQKLNAWLSCAAILVLLGSGVIMYFVGLTPLAWRTGATFVHDWVALAVGLLVLGHIYRAASDVEARRGMRRGSVSQQWARDNHAAWAQEQLEVPPPEELAGRPEGS